MTSPHLPPLFQPLKKTSYRRALPLFLLTLFVLLLLLPSTRHFVPKMTATLISSSSSASSSRPSPPPFDPSTLDEVNASLSMSTPRQILEWATDNLPSLFQTTAFGLTGLAATDMLSKIARKRGQAVSPVPLIFIDTLYHFTETLELVGKVGKRYGTEVRVYRPPGVESVEEFEERYGRELWKSDEETYDYLVKVRRSSLSVRGIDHRHQKKKEKLTPFVFLRLQVEPARRAYAELGVKAVITGRRQSQGADRATLQPIEVDSTGLVKVNPLCRWSFDEVRDYIDMAGVPFNPLLDQGYKSVGDWHSTKVPVEGEGERAGRWAGKTEKTECGLHVDYFKMLVPIPLVLVQKGLETDCFVFRPRRKKAFEKKQREQAHADADKARGEDVDVESSVQLGLLAL